MIAEQAQLSWEQLKKNNSAQIFIGLAILLGVSIGLIITGIANPAILLFSRLLVYLLCFLTVARPEYGLAFLVFISYSRLSDTMKHFNGLPSIAQPFMVLMVGLILGRWVLYNERPKRMGKALTLFALYGVFSFSSLVYAQNFWTCSRCLCCLHKRYHYRPDYRLPYFREHQTCAKLCGLCSLLAY